MKRYFIFLLLFPLFILTKDAEARVLPQAKKAGQQVTTTKGIGVNVFPKLRADRRALVVNFANLQSATAVSYALTYSTAVQDEGAIGSLNLGGSSSATQELLFGTCSRNVCRYHTNITHARLEVSYTTKSGKKYLKKFKIRV